MKKVTLYRLLRIGISISLITFLLSRVDIVELAKALKSANLWWFLVALLLAFSQVFISARRWQVMLSPKGMHVPLGSLTSFYFVGRFFNIFLPTVMGGDVMRGYELAKFSQRAVDSAATVLMERICGFLALFVICWISLPFGLERLEGTNILPIVGGMSFAFLLSLAALFNARLMGKILSLARIVKRWSVENKLKETYNSLRSFTASKRTLANAFVISLIMQLVGIASTFLISQALHLNVSFIYFLTIMPIIWVIIMAPISIAGFGVREGAFVFFFMQQGVSPENALLLSLLWWSLSLVVALVGGVIYGLGRYRRSGTLDAKGGEKHENNLDYRWCRVYRE